MSSNKQERNKSLCNKCELLSPGLYQDFGPDESYGLFFGVLIENRIFIPNPIIEKLHLVSGDPIIVSVEKNEIPRDTKSRKKKTSKKRGRN